MIVDIELDQSDFFVCGWEPQEGDPTGALISLKQGIDVHLERPAAAALVAQLIDALLCESTGYAEIVAGKYITLDELKAKLRHQD